MFKFTMMFFGSLSNVNPLECVSMNNQECKVRLEIVNVNSNEPVFFTFSIKTSKCSGSCNNINDPYAKMCVSDLVENLNVKVFNLISRKNETRHIKLHKLVNVNVDYIQVFVIINSNRMKINVGVNAKN